MRVYKRVPEHVLNDLEDFFTHTQTPDRRQLAMLSRKHKYSKPYIYKWFWTKRRMAKAPQKKRVQVSSDEDNNSSSVTSERQTRGRSSDVPEITPELSLSSTATLKPSSTTIQIPVVGTQTPSQFSSMSSNLESSYFQIVTESDLALDSIFSKLKPQEISVLEKIYAQVPNPTYEEISKLATRFVREQEKEEQINDWFARRRAEALFRM